MPAARRWFTGRRWSVRRRLVVAALVLALVGGSLAAAWSADLLGGGAHGQGHGARPDPTILYFSDGKTVLARIGGSGPNGDASAEGQGATDGRAGALGGQHTAAWWPKGPTGLIVGLVLDEVARTAPFHGDDAFAMLADGGYRIVTTIDLKSQAALESLAGRDSSTSFMKAQPETMQAAGVVIDPKTGQVMAYYGGESGTGTDYAGGTDGRRPSGTGHPPGETFGMYTLAAALQSGLSLRSMWQSPQQMTFPQFGRGESNPVSDQATCPTGEEVCSLADSITAGLRVPSYAVASAVGPEKLVETASAAGVERLADSTGKSLELQGVQPKQIRSAFGPELGYGQTTMTVLDQAAGAATYAADGRHARIHFALSVAGPVANGPGTGELLRESVSWTGTGLTADQIADLTWALSQSPVAKLPDGHTTAAISGQWAMAPAPSSPANASPAASGPAPSGPAPSGSANASTGPSSQVNAGPERYSDAWTVGFTRSLAMAVWVGNKAADQALIDRNGVPVDGRGLPADIYRAFMSGALSGRTTEPFREPAFGGDQAKGNAQPAGSPNPGSSGAGSSGAGSAGTARRPALPTTAPARNGA